MSTRVDPIHWAVPLRWLALPVVGVALFSAAAAALRRRTRVPSVTPMSDEWIREHTAERVR